MSAATLTKSSGATLTALKGSGDEGMVVATLCRLGVVDLDGDIIAVDALATPTEVTVSAWNHGSWGAALPIGKGTVTRVGDTLQLSAALFLNTVAGREHFEVIKGLSDSGRPEWSYSLHEVTSTPSTVDGRKVNLITRFTMREASPVMRGASIGSGTIAAKGLADQEADDALDRLLLSYIAVGQGLDHLFRDAGRRR